ncbi:hypothetical protein OH492_11900 [Vibrio chagasii]|nr:hypothetical protein [Vibrio chagasii]
MVSALNGKSTRSARCHVLCMDVTRKQDVEQRLSLSLRSEDPSYVADLSIHRC